MERNRLESVYLWSKVTLHGFWQTFLWIGGPHCCAGTDCLVSTEGYLFGNCCNRIYIFFVGFGFNLEVFLKRHIKKSDRIFNSVIPPHHWPYRVSHCIEV